MTPKSRPSWAGRLPGGLDQRAWDFLHSLPHDAFLWPYDIEGTIAHVRGLEEASVLKKGEAAKLVKELRSIRERPELIDPGDEDVHSAIERVLTERLGEVGAKVHAGRSRNDQVATATRLWVRDEIRRCLDGLRNLLEALTLRAEENASVLAPGYTHLQRAQPVTVGHWLCAHAWALGRDLERFAAALRSTEVLPLGAGALATSSLGIDPAVARRELGFPKSFENSMDAVSDRDFLCDATYACVMVLTHLSRLSEEVVLWASSEFSFIELPDAFATGSSMMPQKKNPDVAEVARGSAGLAVGALTGLLVTLKGLPLAYNRDLQLDKQHARAVFAATAGALEAMAGLVSGLTFDTQRLEQAASDPSLLATDVAEELVGQGVPFRRAHERVAELVREGALGKGKGAAASVRGRRVSGGPSARSVKAQVRRLRRMVEKSAQT